MGCCGEIVAEKHGVTREEQDAYALESHRKAIAATRPGKFKDEIVPVPIPQKKGDPVLFAEDESPARGHVAGGAGAAEAGLPGGRHGHRGQRAGRQRRRGGAGRDVGGDGAARWAAKPMARIVAQATSGLEPKMVMMTPVPAVRKIFEKTGWTADDVDLVELNEAFAVQAVAVTRGAGARPRHGQRERRRGRPGPPIGASGARVLTTLLYALRDRGDAARRRHPVPGRRQRRRPGRGAV